MSFPPLSQPPEFARFMLSRFTFYSETTLYTVEQSSLFVSVESPSLPVFLPWPLPPLIFYFDSALGCLHFIFRDIFKCPQLPICSDAGERLLPSNSKDEVAKP